MSSKIITRGASLNWGRLVAQGRAKDIGIPWSDEELAALKSGMKPDEVRAGILKPSQRTKEKKSSLKAKSLPELKVIAMDLGIKFDDVAVTKSALVSEIEAAQKKA